MTATTTARRFGSVRRHKNRWQARYLDSDSGRVVARNWPTETIAREWLAWIDARRHRWPGDALCALAGYDSARQLATELGIGHVQVCRSLQRGLSDIEADRYAVALGYHPAAVWGHEWITAGLDTFPADTTSDTDDGDAADREAVA
jgi:hypothetical protein